MAFHYISQFPHLHQYNSDHHVRVADDHIHEIFFSRLNHSLDCTTTTRPTPRNHHSLETQQQQLKCARDYGNIADCECKFGVCVESTFTPTSQARIFLAR